MKKISISQLDIFLDRFYCGKFLNQRMGQAFCNYFPEIFAGTNNSILFYEKSQKRCLTQIFGRVNWEEKSIVNKV